MWEKLTNKYIIFLIFFIQGLNYFSGREVKIAGYWFLLSNEAKAHHTMVTTAIAGRLPEKGGTRDRRKKSPGT